MLLLVVSSTCALRNPYNMEKKNHPASQAAATYQPAPIDTTGVVLPESLLKLTETIARNTHEVWARQRMDEGWRYGPSRDDVRHRPDLNRRHRVYQTEGILFYGTCYI